MTQAFWVSAKVTLLAMLFVVPAGAALGLYLARSTGLRRGVIDALVIAPLVMPPSVTGYYLLVVLGARGVVGAWLDRAFGARLVFSTTGAAVAAAVVSLPLMVKGAEAAFSRVDHALVEVARANGMRPRDVFRRITLPLASPGLAAAVTLTAVRALGEFGATLTFAGYAEGRTSTAPLEMYVALQNGDDARAGALALGLVVASLAAAIALTSWGRRVRS